MELKEGHRYCTKDGKEVVIIHVGRGAEYPICGKLFYTEKHGTETFMFLSYKENGLCKEADEGTITHELRPKSPRELAMELLKNDDLDGARRVLDNAAQEKQEQQEQQVIASKRYVGLNSTGGYPR